jgi:predicted transcriptional regulator
MGTDSVGRVAVLSIHPAYAQRILDGTKRVEFRKRPLANDVTHVLLYATAPVSAIVGAFAVDGQRTLSPQMLWREFRNVAGIGWGDFRAYYAGRRAGTGIAVGQVFRPDEPLCLRQRLGIARPPQSVQYLNSESAASALRGMNPAGDPSVA